MADIQTKLLKKKFMPGRLWNKKYVADIQTKLLKKKFMPLAGFGIKSMWPTFKLSC